MFRTVATGRFRQTCELWRNLGVRKNARCHHDPAGVYSTSILHANPEPIAEPLYGRYSPIFQIRDKSGLECPPVLNECAEPDRKANVRVGDTLLRTIGGKGELLRGLEKC